MSMNSATPKRLKPEGHSAFVESLVQPIIVIASTLMSAIAAYVLASDEITRLLNNRGTPQDVFVVCLCAGMGLVIDTAIIVSATRYKMHKVRNDPRENGWLKVSKAVLIIGMSTEAMTTFYFFVQLSPSDFPWWLIWFASVIHMLLSVVRAFLIPITVAYFVAGILPIMFDRSDLNREIMSRTSSNIALIVDRLSIVFDTDDKAELLRALAGQLMLNTYAKYDDTTHTTEEHQIRRDGKLLAHFGRIHRLDWSSIAADVAPELATLPAPQPAHAPAALPPAPMYPAGFEASQRLPAATQEGARDALPAPLDHPDLSAETILAQVRRELHLPAEPHLDEPPPDDGGAPSFASKRIAQEADATVLDGGNVTPLRRGLGRASAAPRRDRKAVNRVNARGGKRGTAEYKVRRVVASKPDADLDEVAHLAKVSSSTASKWLEVINAERRGREMRDAQ